MNAYQISINQLVNFGHGTQAKKRDIILMQLNPLVPKLFWYQLAKSRIRKFFKLNRDKEVILDGIEFLKNREAEKPRQQIDKILSIEVLKRFLKIKHPQVLNDIKLELTKASEKGFLFEDVEIRVAPEIIFRGSLNGKRVVGAIKLHISKDKPFNQQQAEEVALIIHKYLKESVITSDETALRDLCFCLDIFGNRLVSAPEEKQITPKLKRLTAEIKSMWDKVLNVEVQGLEDANPLILPILKLSVGKPKLKDLTRSRDGSFILKFWPSNYWEAKYLLMKGGIEFQIITT